MLRAVSLMDTDLEPDSWHCRATVTKTGMSFSTCSAEASQPLKELPPETCGLANSCTGKVAAAPFLMQVP